MDQLDRIFAQEEQGPSYARYDNPTRSALEELVSELEGGAGAIACASGMIAIHPALLAALLDRPKRVVAASAIYGATTNLLMNILGPWASRPRSWIPATWRRSKKPMAEDEAGRGGHGNHLESAAARGRAGQDRRDVHAKPTRR